MQCDYTHQKGIAYIPPAEDFSLQLDQSSWEKLCHTWHNWWGNHVEAWKASPITLLHMQCKLDKKSIMNVSAVPFSISIKHPSNKPALTCPGGAPCCGVCRGLSLRWWLPLPKMWMGQRTGLCKRADQKSKSKFGTLLLTVNPFIACFDVKVYLSSFEQVKAESSNGQGGSDIFQGLSRCLHYQHGWSTFVRPAASLWPCGLFLGWTSAGCSFEQKRAYVLWHSMRQKRTVPFRQQLISGLSENQMAMGQN